MKFNFTSNNEHLNLKIKQKQCSIAVSPVLGQRFVFFSHKYITLELKSMEK